MDDRALRHFVNLAETLHFGRASERGHVSPSALSRCIQRTEEVVGTALFERSNRRVTLTRAGRLFLDYARNALGEWDALRGTLMEQAGELHGELGIYCSVTASYSFLFEILARFRLQHPRIEIKLHTGDPEEAIGRVLAGREDIAIGARPDRVPAGLAFRPITTSPLLYIAGVQSGYEHLGTGRHSRKSDWENVPMILSERGLARERSDRWFRQLGVVPSIYAQVAGNEAIVSMVSLGFGVGIVPKIVLDNSPLRDTVRVLDVRPALQAFEVGLFALEKRIASPLVGAFWAGTEVVL